MSYSLAIFAPYIGAPSETFIQRYMQDLLPGGTVVVANSTYDGRPENWSLNGPTLMLNGISNRGITHKVIEKIVERINPPCVPHQRSIKHFLRKHGVRVILAQYLDKYLPWISLSREMGIRFFGHGHGYDLSEKLRDPYIRSAYLQYNHSSGIITINKKSRDRLLDLGIASDKLFTVPYGVDVPEIPVPRAGGPPFRCITVGRMVGKKAPILLLDAFRRAAEQFPNVRLDYVGEGPLRTAVRQFIQAFRLADRVTLHGSQPNGAVQQLMRQSDIFIQHSMTDSDTGDEEGLPVAILEAMANGLPVIATRHAGVSEAVEDDLTGFLVDEGDSLQMARCLITLLRSPDRCQAMGIAGWKRAAQHFSWERERTALLDIMQLHSSR